MPRCSGPSMMTKLIINNTNNTRRRNPCRAIALHNMSTLHATILVCFFLIVLSSTTYHVESFAVANGAGGGSVNGVNGAGNFFNGVNGDGDASKKPTTPTNDEHQKQENDEYQTLNIAFVTGNQMKVRELEMILSEYLSANSIASSSSSSNDKNDTTNSANARTNVTTTTTTTNDNFAFNVRIVNVDLPEIQEVNTEAIAKEKALLAAQLAGGPCLVEDTSLKFHALGGMPGPYIKWFQEKLKSDGLYKILMAYEDKSATAICTLAFCSAPHADPVLFTGEIHGTIVEPQQGKGGFGWDSIFVPNGTSQPFSCMTIEEKNQYSHRGKAVRQWAKWVTKNRHALLERQSGQRAIGHKGLDFKCLSPEQ